MKLFAVISMRQRALRVLDEADEGAVHLTADDRLAEDHLEALRAADEDGVEVRVGGVPPTVRERVEAAAPSVTSVETPRERSDTPAGSLRVVDGRAALVGVRVHGADRPAEVAIRGSGRRNSLVVVLRATVTWQPQRRLGVRSTPPGESDASPATTTDDDYDEWRLPNAVTGTGVRIPEGRTDDAAAGGDGGGDVDGARGSE